MANTLRLLLKPETQRNSYFVGERVQLWLVVVDTSGKPQPVIAPQIVVTLSDGREITYTSASWRSDGFGAWTIDLLLNAPGTWEIAASVASPSGLTGSVSLTVEDTLPLSASRPTASITRPNDTNPYQIGDLIANNTTAGSVTASTIAVARRPGASGRLLRAKLHKSGTSVTNASFRVHLFSAASTPVNGDNGAWSVSGAASYIGSFDVTVDRAFTDGAAGVGAPLTGAVMEFSCASNTTNLWWQLEARAAYTPITQEVFTLTLEVDRD